MYPPGTLRCLREPIHVDSATGHLMKSIIASGTPVEIDIADGPKGLYLIRSQAKGGPVLKFIRL